MNRQHKKININLISISIFLLLLLSPLAVFAKCELIEQDCLAACCHAEPAQIATNNCHCFYKSDDSAPASSLPSSYQVPPLSLAQNDNIICLTFPHRAVSVLVNTNDFLINATPRYLLISCLII